jgi:hypothetical protein
MTFCPPPGRKQSVKPVITVAEKDGFAWTRGDQTADHILREPKLPML